MRFGQGRGVEILPSIGGFANGRRHGAKESINVYQTENGTVAKKYNSFPIKITLEKYTYMIYYIW